MAKRPRDDELAQIQILYRRLMAFALPHVRKEESPAYRALIKEIRAEVDARTVLRGDEMIVACEKAPIFGNDDDEP